MAPRKKLSFKLKLGPIRRSDANGSIVWLVLASQRKIDEEEIFGTPF
jgi:hypothetical protein